LTAKLSQIIHDSQTPAKAKKRHGKIWFDGECRILKKRCLEAIGTDQYNSTRQLYKKTLKEKSQKHEYKELIEKIQQSRSKPWILLPKKPLTAIPPVTMQSFTTYFSSLLTTTSHSALEPDLALDNQSYRETYNLVISRNFSNPLEKVHITPTL